jgi:hypothetical protein
MLIPSPRLDNLSRVLLQASLSQGYSDAELLIVVTFLQDQLLKGDRPLRAVLGSIVNTGDDDLRLRFLHDFIGICGESTSIH